MASWPAPYPPTLSQTQLSNLVFNVKDYQITHGMLLKYGSDANSVHAVPIGVSLFPTLFPQSLFEDARRLQTVYNKLYSRVAQDEEWLHGILGGLIRDGGLAGTLWWIYQEVNGQGYVQDVTLGLFRSDYMVHIADESSPQAKLSLKQVEFNTYSVAGGAHANNAADMHQHLTRTCANGVSLGSKLEHASGRPMLPENETIRSLVSGLGSAHEAYGPPKSGQASHTGVLFVVQPRNMNICDERPLEYALWNHDPPIPAYRVVFGQDVLAHTSLTDTRVLLYQPPSSSRPIEVSVCYLRAGYDPDEYNPAGISCRLLLERSCAIKCPSILGHLATFKKVQQALAAPGALSRFLAPTEAELIAKTFAPMYPMNDSTEAGRCGRALACNPATAVNHVLKPSLEGGGHNVYRGDIPGFLKATPESRWHTYILMESIQPVLQKNILLSARGMYTAEDAGVVEDAPLTFHSGPQPLQQQQQRLQHDDIPYPSSGPHPGSTVSELGIFGVCLWRSNNNNHLPPKDNPYSDSNSNSPDPDPSCPTLLLNIEAGWSFKTKPAAVDEMSVVKGYGCFDAPWLVSDEMYLQTDG